MTHVGRDNTTTERPNRICVCIISFIIFPVIYLIYEGNSPQNIFKTPAPANHQQTHKACGFPVQSGTMIPVDGTKSYVVTPYVEHRDVAKEVRAISVVLREETANYCCMLCCKGHNFSVAATRNVHSDHFGFDYGTGDILCPVVNDCDTPEYVAIYSDAAASDREWKPTFIPVQNQQPKTSRFNYNFTVCISTMFADYDNVLQVVQAMEMFRLLGVDRVALYKTSCSSEMQKVLDYYESMGFVELVPWPVAKYIFVSDGWRKSESPGDLHYYGQIPALNDCVYRYMYRSKYVALQDIDEYILPLRVENWNQLLKQLEDEYGTDKGFEFEDHIFPNNVVDGRGEFRPQEWGSVHGINILEHVLCEPLIPGSFNNIKVIANPRLLFEVTVHGFLKTQSGSVPVPAEVAHLYHIRRPSNTRLTKAQLIRDVRLRHYAPRLIPAVTEVLKKL
ncbi:uncharacterized protein si:zfos-464b6.2 [Megalops cyprinoides]|uniref:uncharacterized protein si:zfos-464b6.2 n=1 Tax=Megalops cyprinoides TaxID=118141 RepID=UPI001864F7AC|nr:uncharacterized protein si:zfos-464b6.2 [Megalops cyprinoides]XP_036392992.1 uncharacterized protein si:zfos-464b6.2 [Megalops cyprinoides]XP_036392993.1 uncharacterized protein si:zfos-464b6.2 [Megalops cyprinoides]XP_036392994.1 uncharacterized protein si:zfos-464b6.2 [Megalops cyprinoides]